MVTQPAYLSKLKAYAKLRLGFTRIERKQTITGFSKESDRGAIILAAATIEDFLEYEIVIRLPALAKDEPARKRLFEQDGQLASFSKKTELAYAMGIIDKDYRKKIELIREIRDACTHARMPLSMNREVLREPCVAAISDMLPGLKDRKPRTVRNAFVTKCAIIGWYIVSGEKIEGPDAPARHFQRLQDAIARGKRPFS